MEKFETETDKFGHIHFVSVVFPFWDQGNGDWTEVGLLLACSSLCRWTDSGFFPLPWHCRRDQREIEEVGDELTEDWCSCTEKPGRKAAQSQTHSSRSKAVRRIRPIILFFSAPLKSSDMLALYK